MTPPADPVFAGLRELPAAELSPEFAGRLRSKVQARLRPRRVHPVWTVTVAISVVCYLGWAMQFTGWLLSGG